MDFVESIPFELLEEIFLYLSSRDIISCSQVSKQWREVSNSNKIWARKCLAEKIHDKIFLDQAMSAMKNPSKKFREHRTNYFGSLSPPCHWRSHYDRYKFLDRNWRRGTYAIHWLKLNPMHYSDGLVMGKRNLENSRHYCLYDMSKFKCMNLSDCIPFRVDNVIFQNGYLIYSHNLEITCQLWDQTKEKFVEKYTVDIRDYADFIEPHSVPPLCLMLSERYLIVQNSADLFIIQLYDSKTGTFKKEMDLKPYAGNRSTKINFGQVLGDRFYIGYEYYDKWFILQYDYVKEQLTAKIEVPGMPSIVASKNFFCAKINQNQFDLSSELKVWSSHTGAEVAVYCTDKSSTPIFTSGDKIIYYDSERVYIRGLLRVFERDIPVPSRVAKMCQVRDKFLVCNLTCSVQMWDIVTGQRLYVLYRRTFRDIWVDDRAIVVKEISSMTSGDSYAIAFW